MKLIAIIILSISMLACAKQPISESDRIEKRDFILECIKSSNSIEDNVVEQCRMTAGQLYG